MKRPEQEYKVVYDRTNCIGAAACVTAHPKKWQIVGDGKADLGGAQKKENNELQELIITEKELEAMKQAAKACPVNVIHIIDLKTNKKII